MHNLSREQKIELVKLRKKRSVESLSIATVAGYYETRYEWQRKFISATAEYRQCALIAANRWARQIRQLHRRRSLAW